MGGRICKAELTEANKTCAVDWAALVSVVHEGGYVRFNEGKMVLDADYGGKQYELHLTSTGDMLVNNSKLSVEIRAKGAASGTTIEAALFFVEPMMPSTGAVYAYLWADGEPSLLYDAQGTGVELVEGTQVTVNKRLNIGELDKVRKDYRWTLSVSASHKSAINSTVSNSESEQELGDYTSISDKVTVFGNRKVVEYTAKHKLQHSFVSANEKIVDIERQIPKIDTHISQVDGLKKARWNVLKAHAVHNVQTTRQELHTEVLKDLAATEDMIQDALAAIIDTTSENHTKKTAELTKATQALKDGRGTEWEHRLKTGITNLLHMHSVLTKMNIEYTDKNAGDTRTIAEKEADIAEIKTHAKNIIEELKIVRDVYDDPPKQHRKPKKLDEEYRTTVGVDKYIQRTADAASIRSV